MARRHQIEPGAPLLPHIAELIDAYEPRDLPIEKWVRVGEEVKGWVRLAGPTDRQVTQKLLLGGARLGLWALDQQLPLDATLLFTPDILDRFIEWTSANDNKARAVHLRAALRRYAPALAKPGTWPLPGKQYARNKVPRPLSHNTELALLTSGAAHSPQFGAFCALGFGCGLDGRWLPHVRGTDVFEREGWTYVQVPDPDARVVPVRAPFVNVLIAAAEAVGDNYLIGGNPTDRNRSWYIARRLPIAPGRRLNIAELRVTWFAAHLRHNTDLRYLRQIAGMSSFHRLVEVMDYLEDPEWAPLDLHARGA